MRCSLEPYSNALAHIQRGVERVAEVQTPAGEVFIMRQLGIMCALDGQWDRAAQALDRSHQVLRETPDLPSGGGRATGLAGARSPGARRARSGGGCRQSRRCEVCRSDRCSSRGGDGRDPACPDRAPHSRREGPQRGRARPRSRPRPGPRGRLAPARGLDSRGARGTCTSCAGCGGLRATPRGGRAALPGHGPAGAGGAHRSTWLQADR